MLPELVIAYHTWGTLNESGDNAVWVCHALTANSNAVDWWPGLIGEGLPVDTATQLVVCANILGSCYGTTGPASTNPVTMEPYYQSFPRLTIRDMVAAHRLLQHHLQINHIRLLVGGSMGGYQCLEWAAAQPLLFSRLALLATSARESAWGIAIHTAQRMAIETDPTWQEANEEAGKEGLKVARAIGMVTYRSYQSFVQKQSEGDDERMDDFKASSYIRYQGDKLAKRFSAHSYWQLTKAMDTHNLARSRESLESVLQSIPIPALIIGITSDLLCPLQEQALLTRHLPNATFIALDSLYGHDGFLVETTAIGRHLSHWLSAQQTA